MVNKNIIFKRLERLNEYLTILHDLQQYSFETFVADPQLYGSVERFLHLAVEVTLDLGSHIVADDQLGSVDVYRDIVRNLIAANYLDSTLGATWLDMIGFRNILVHEYATIDRKIVYDVLQNHLGDLEALRDFFGRFL
jgi:uncharacterized protein YutE (UPF0331/DUF86 family)